MYNLENAPIELIRCLELGLPMPSGLLQRFPLVVLEQWRQLWMEGPGRKITAERRGIELEHKRAENLRREQIRQEQMAYWIEPGSIVIINAPRTPLDQRQGRLADVIWGKDNTLYSKVVIEMASHLFPMKTLASIGASQPEPMKKDRLLDGM